MCTTCGCGDPNAVHYHVDENGTITMHSHHDHDHEHEHDHDHHHHHDHDHDHDHAHPEHSHAAGVGKERAVAIEEDILGRNNAKAAELRRGFAASRILALNFVSSPGSGKTTLLAATLKRLAEEADPIGCFVVEGDQQTRNDADRIRAAGAPAVQINTGKGCHLDADMIGKALEVLKPAENSILFIENVGNLVCPAAFDLGEAHKVAVLSVTEGEDKPLKYPDMFRAADLVLINKIDLLPYLDFDVDACEAFCRQVNPKAKILRVSAAKGEGMDKWIAWLKAAHAMAAL